MDKFIDPGAERAILSSIISGGKDAFIDASTYISNDDFALPLNKIIYTCIEKLFDEENCNKIDAETIKLKAKALGLDKYFAHKKEIEYLELISQSYIENSNLKVFGLQIRKFSIVRELHKRYNNALKYIENVDASEKLSNILQKAEQEVIDFNLDLDSSNKIEKLGDQIEDYISDIINKPIIDQIGLPTGFTQWDKAIGGGLRKSTINIISARAKKGKSWLALNMAINLAKIGIPVLYLDTELTIDYQKSRMLSVISECPIRKIETRKIQHFPELKEKLINSEKILKDIPLFYKNISGCSHEEALAYTRRWIVKNVGFDNAGCANNCVVVYDYMKLTSGDALSKHTPEYILLGLMLTDMHNFAVKYNIPILGFVQLNRQGIDNDDTSIIAGSDRILWLCSSMSVLRDKEQTDIEMGSQWEHGNKKLSILETRFGAGLENPNDYINLHASLRPNVSDEEATGLIREGFKHSEVFSGYGNPTETTRPRQQEIIS